MNLKERNDFCWASRHALMDLVMLEIYQVKDKVGVANFIETMPQKQLIETTLNCLNLPDGDQDILLNEMYRNHLKELRPDLPIQDSKVWMDRDAVLTEASDGDEDVARKAIEIAKGASLAAAITYIGTVALTKPDEAAKAVKAIQRVYGGKAIQIINRYPILKGIADPTAKRIKNADRMAQNPKAAARLAKIKLKQPVSVMKKMGKVGMGVTASALLAYGIYKRLTDPARKACANQSGRQKTACILKYKIQATGEAIRSLEKGMGGCDENPDPQKCKYSFQKKIWYWNKRKQGYQDKLAKLTQNKSQFRTHKKMN